MADEELLPHQSRVRVTMFADPIVVDTDELPGLRSQGLLIEADSTEAGAAIDAAKAELGELGSKTARPKGGPPATDADGATP